MHLDPLALSVCRLDKYPELLRLEKEADRVNTLALRVLYGFLTYMDDLVPSSPAGMYSNFLESMDAAVRKRLKLEDVYQFVERMTGTGGGPHSFFLLQDEFNAVTSEAEVGLLTCAHG